MTSNVCLSLLVVVILSILPLMNDAYLPVVDVMIPAEKAENRAAQRKAIARVMGLAVHQIKGFRLLKRSIDARRKFVQMQLRFEVSVEGELLPSPLPQCLYPVLKEGAPSIIIVGFGPAGIFAALRCIESGIRPIILERGKDVSRRRFDLAPIMREGRIVEDSNYCFGEGGAGTFSDGKLYTRATKRGPIREIFETFVAHGAPADILVDAHPHIGSNLLPNVVKAMRCSILASGGEIYFESKVDKLLLSKEKNRILGVGMASGEEFLAPAVILATGHSARDVYYLLNRLGIALEAKPFAMGVRIEHSQQFVDEHQYHLSPQQARPEYLPAARYALATKIRDRGVHSFCMCPGGFIVPSATENDELVVNGMSLSRRDSPFANSGFVVSVEPEDTQDLVREHGVLAGVAFQKKMEQEALLLGGGKQKAPAQRVQDFLKEKISNDLPQTSYFPGATSVPLHDFLPQGITTRMQEALVLFNDKMRGFTSSEALLIGLESRTSSPIRIPRDGATMQHIHIKGLYPAGEGAGYAGGIASAAIDGRRCAEAAIAQLLRG